MARPRHRTLTPEPSRLPGWMSSPETPSAPERVEKIPEEQVSVVECDGRLFDRITLYRLHHYAPPASFRAAGGLLGAYLRNAWHPVYVDGPDTDAKPENAEIRAHLAALGAEAAASPTSPALEQRRAWRVVDWEIRTYAAAHLELAGWGDYAAEFRTLPPITGPSLPRGAATVFRKAHRDTDRASTAALQGRRPYVKRGETAGDRMRLASRGNPGVRLAGMLGDTVPRVASRVRGDVMPRERTDMGRAVLAGAHARTCIDLDPRIPDAEVARVAAELSASGHALVRELINMGRA